MEVIELRGHHLEPLKHVHQVSRQEFFRELSEDPYKEDYQETSNWVPYVTSLDDHFMSVGYDQLKAILSNPENKIRLIEDRPDFICAACPPDKREECKKKSQILIGSAFKISQEKEPYGDWAFAKKFGLEIGRTYTANQIRKALQLPDLT